MFNLCIIGNYSSAKVFLSGNFLTRFEEGAFKSMLEDMSSKDAKGFLDVGFSKLYIMENVGMYRLYL